VWLLLIQQIMAPASSPLLSPQALLDHDRRPLPRDWSTPGRVREAYEGNRAILPELKIFGWLHFHQALANALRPDIHRNTYEIHYVLSGKLDWWIGDRAYEIRAGQAVIIRKGDLHGARDNVLQPCQKFWLRVNLDEPLPGLGAAETRRLKKIIDEELSHVIAITPRVLDVFQQLLEEHRNPSKMSELVCRSLLHIILAFVARHSGDLPQPVDESERKISYAIRKVLTHILECEQTEERPPTVSSLAEVANMSEGAFRRRFEQEVGFTPLGYMNYRRIERSKAMLRAGRTVTEVAFDLEFSSSQYFATVFKKITGMTPSEFVVRPSAP
jgi:AraC family transcriptional regulator, L-rhamnose operon regulatory protein RhaS